MSQSPQCPHASLPQHPVQGPPQCCEPHGSWDCAEHWNVRGPSWEYTDQGTLFSLRSPPISVSAQVNFPPAVSTMEAARICVCSPTKGMLIVPAEGAASSRTTLPAGVRKPVGAGMGRLSGVSTRDPSSSLQPRLQGCPQAGLQLMKASPSPAVNSSCRAQDEFECANGECISFSLTCDGVSHCKDKSDEKPSYCSKRPLQPLLLLPQSPAPWDPAP